MIPSSGGRRPLCTSRSRSDCARGRALLRERGVGVLAETGRPPEADRGLRRRPHPRTGRGDRLARAERVVVDLVEVVARRELRAGQHVGRRGDRRDEQLAGARQLQQVRLRPCGAELADDPLDPFVLRDRLAAVHQVVGVAQPVLVAGRLVAQPDLVDARHQPSRERPDRRAEQEQHRDEAVCARPQQLDVEPGDLDPAAHPLRRHPAERDRQDVALRRLQHRALRRHLDVLAAAADAALAQRQQRPDRGVGARVEERLRDRRPHGRAVVVAGHRQLARGGVDREVRGRPRRLRAVRPERRDRDRHERRIGSTQRGEVDGHRAALDHDVGAGAQPGQAVPPGVRFEVEHDAALAAVPAPKRQRALGVPAVTGERAAPSAARTLRRFDEHDVGAEPGEHERGEVAALVGQVDDPIPLQHPAALSVAPDRPIVVARPPSPAPNAPDHAHKGGNRPPARARAAAAAAGGTGRAPSTARVATRRLRAPPSWAPTASAGGA